MEIKEENNNEHINTLQITPDKAKKFLKIETSDWNVALKDKNFFIRTKVMKGEQMVTSRATLNYKISPEQFNFILKRIDKIYKYTDKIIEAEIIEKISEDELIVYFCIKTPMIMQNRDFVIKIISKKIFADYDYLLVRESVEHPDKPPVKGRTRGNLSVIHGIKGIGETGEYSKLEVWNIMDPKGSLPKILVNKLIPFLVKKLPAEFKNMYEKTKEAGLLENIEK